MAWILGSGNPAAAAPNRAGPITPEALREALRAGAPEDLAALWALPPDSDQLQVVLQQSRPILRAHARWRLADRALQRSDVEAALEHRSAAGWIGRVWMAPAGLAAPSWEALAAVPEERWRVLDASLASGAFRPAAASSPQEGRSAWLLVVLESDSDRQVNLRVGSSGEVRLAASGGAFVRAPTRPEARLDQSGWIVPLPRGLAAIALHLSGGSRAGEAILRITDAREGAPTGTTARAEPEARTRALALALDRAVSRSADSNDAKWRRLPPLRSSSSLPSTARGWGLRAVLTTALALTDDQTSIHPAERDWSRALELSPTWADAWAHKARLAADRDPATAREDISRALELDPDHAGAWVALGDLEREAELPLAAAAAYDRALTADPRQAEAWARRSELGFDELGETAAAVQRLSSSPARSEPAVAAQLSRLQAALGNDQAAMSTAREGLNVDWTHALMRSTAYEAAIRSGDTPTALALAHDARRLEPDRPRWFLELVRLHAGREPARAAVLLKEAQRRFPSVVEVWVASAELALAGGRREEARRFVDVAARLDPGREELRAWSRALAGGLRPPDDEALAATRALAALPPSEAERQRGGAVLLDARHLELLGDGAWFREIHRVIRVLDPDRHRDRSTQTIEHAPTRESIRVLTARRIDREGRSHAPKDTEDSGPVGRLAGMYIDLQTKTIDFGPLRAGDVIELRYRVESLGPSPFGAFFGSVEPVQDTLPTRAVHIVAESPRARPLFSSQQGLPPPEVEVTAESFRLEYRARDLPALPLEPLGPAYTEHGAFVSLTTYERWSELAAWYAELYAPQLVLDEAARAAGRAVTRGLASNDAIVRALFDHVVKSTRYVGIELGIHGWKPFPAHEVFRRRYGDCKDKSALLIALLADHGISASLVLVRTVDRGPFPDDSVNLWAFNHALTYVPDLDLYLDPTTDFGTSASLPPLDQGAFALRVAPDGAFARVRLPAGGPDEHENTADYVAELTPDGELWLEGVERYEGAPAAEVRRAFEEVDARTRQLELRMGRHFPGFTVDALAFEGMTNRDAPLSYRYTARVGRYGQRRGDRMTMSLSLFQHNLGGTLASSQTRQTPIRILHPWRATNRVRYRLPPRTSLEELPSGVRIDTPWVTLEQSVERRDDGWVVEDVVTFSARRVAVVDYPAFREACFAIDRAMNRKVVLQWR